MGNYNPHVPQILGQEWVPIREQVLTLTPALNLVEVGHGFTLTTTRTIQTARFYLQNWPPGAPFNQVMLASVYQRGTVHLSGPVRSVIVPVSAGTATPAGVTLQNASTVAQALANPTDFAAIQVNTGSAAQLRLRFETDSYTPLLMGKRILGINLIYNLLLDQSTDPPIFVTATISSTGSSNISLGSLRPTGVDVFGTSTAFGRKVVGEVDYHWFTPVTGPTEVLPWSPQRVRAFDDSSGLTERVIMWVNDAPTANQTILYDYAALEILYCDEQRLLWGGRRSIASSGGYILGANQITMRDLSDVANPSLPGGDYDLVLSSANVTAGDAAPYPDLNQIRQLYAIPPHPAVRVIRPFPMDPTAVGKTFTKEETLLLPHLSLHTSGGPITEVHVYGRQAAAQVYGTITATQEILDGAANSAGSYPWVRYYARRFGATTVPLKLDSPTISGAAFTVSITPPEWDALEEIVDGWKEITLRFPTTGPTMGAGTNPQWRWSATGEFAADRWEVLGAYAPALSGIPGNLLNLVPSPHQLSLATYGAPVSGANINLGWVPQYAPPVSATVDDQTADATLIFAKDMFTVTGFGSTEQEQTVTGIGLDCGLNPCCIPTSIRYVQLSWGTPPGNVIVNDTFTRSGTGWGTATSGQTYTDSGGTVPGNYVTTGTKGTHVLDSANVIRHSTIAGFIGDSHQRVTASLNVLPVGASIRQRIIGHFVDVNNYDYVDFRSVTSGTNIEIVIANLVGGVVTAQSNIHVGATAIDREWYFDVDFNGSNIRAKAWVVGTEEPALYQATGTSVFATGGVGIGSIRSTGNTDSGAIASYDNYTVGPSTWNFGKYELQRMDTVETDWKTIMAATSATTTGFRDYEARVGILSSYRIRAVDVYDFPGPWSSTITRTLSSPGVDIGCTGGHLLIFTSNEQQDGSINLAYSSVWEGQVEESFAFPESRFVELQAMYNRDFFVAFRPMERGGEQFSRTVLVQAAAISPETLGDFTSLRDMAWADVSYICVRDEDGNRWFATVMVPSGRVLRDRRLYMAPVEIIEVTDTPSEVNP